MMMMIMMDNGDYHYENDGAFLSSLSSHME